MAIGVIGRKRGMMRVFTEDGASIPVSVIEVEPNRISQIKTADTDGYDAVQVTTGTRRANRVDGSTAGHFKKAGVEPGRGLWEFRLNGGADEELAAGGAIKADHFSEGQSVDVTGISIGKGFAGGVKRHNFRTQGMSHGTSLAHRAPGSIGQGQTPGRVFKGKKMAGHLGAARRTVQNLQVVRVDIERNLLLIRGAVPGSRGGDLVVQPSIKAKAE